MPLPNLPYAIQTNWNDDNAWGAGLMWEQPNANFLSTCLLSLRVEREIMRPALGAGRCTIVATDPNWDVVPAWPSSVLYPNVREGRRLRVLAQSPTAPGTWYPWFFGYIDTIEPTISQDPPDRVTITASSALTILADLPVTLPALVDPVVYDPANPDTSALTQLLMAAGLWQDPILELSATAGNIQLTGTWGDTTTTLGEGLAQLCGLSGCIIDGAPRYAVSAGQPDWRLRWLQPLPADTPAWHWDNTAGDLTAGAQVQFRRRVVVAA